MQCEFLFASFLMHHLFRQKESTKADRQWCWGLTSRRHPSVSCVCAPACVFALEEQWVSQEQNSSVPTLGLGCILAEQLKETKEKAIMVILCIVRIPDSFTAGRNLRHYKEISFKIKLQENFANSCLTNLPTQ